MTQIVPGYPPDTRRLRAVVERVAKDSGWDEKVKQYKDMKGRGLGIAAHRSFLSYVAIVADVSLNDKNELTINEIFGVIDCGLAVNRDRVKAQMEGGIIYGLSYALLGEITVKNGAVVQNNFDDYPVLRIHQTPKIHTYIQDPPPEVVKEYDGNVRRPASASRRRPPWLPPSPMRSSPRADRASARSRFTRRSWCSEQSPSPDGGRGLGNGLLTPFRSSKRTVNVSNRASFVRLPYAHMAFGFAWSCSDDQ